MHPPHRQSLARISEELCIHVMTLYKWRKAWQLQGVRFSRCLIEMVEPSSCPAAIGWDCYV